MHIPLHHISFQDRLYKGSADKWVNNWSQNARSDFMHHRSGGMGLKLMIDAFADDHNHLLNRV